MRYGRSPLTPVDNVRHGKAPLTPVFTVYSLFLNYIFGMIDPG